MGNKKISKIAKSLLCIWNIALFIAVWFGKYNNYAFDEYRMYGGIISCVIFTVIYIGLCNLYQAFRIASTHITDTIFGQTISFGIADLLLYIECCLIHNGYVNVLPGLGITVLQIFGSTVIVIKAKQYLMTYMQAQKTLLIYGSIVSEKSVMQFKEHLMGKYSHMFAITHVISELSENAQIEGLIQSSEVVLMYEISENKRSYYMKLCTENRKSFYFTPRIEDIFCQGSSIRNLLDTPLMKYDYNYESASGYIGKRTLDIVLSLLGLIVLSPVLLITALCIKLEDYGPVFYRQKRCTRNGKVFEIIKFRSMVVDAEKNGVTPCTENDARVTRVGRIIRATRIDELPQMINILKSDMSFVGPRPERIEHVEQYTKELPEFAYRLRVKGGLTGYAQIFGKYNTSAYDKLRLDLMYIENQSLLLDLKILLLTIKTVFQSESTEGFSEERSWGMDWETKNEKSI